MSKKNMALLGLGAVALLIVGVIAGYYWAKITIPVEVKEPLEIVGYPTLVELYAGENVTFTVNVTNHATVSYLVTMEFSLNDTVYQTSYVTFSNIFYTVIPGDNTLEAWIAVDGGAPPATLELSVDFSRAATA